MDMCVPVGVFVHDCRYLRISEVSDLLELKLWVVVNHRVWGDGNVTQFLLESSKLSYLLESL